MPLNDLAQYFQKSEQQNALACLEELKNSYFKAREQVKRLPATDIKYVLRVLRRAAKNPSSAARLKDKTRLDADSILLLGLDKLLTPTPQQILERISVLENYRKLHRVELERLHCGYLRLLYVKYGCDANDHAQRRAFVAAALDLAEIAYPDPNKNPGRLDDWINTPVEPLSAEAHKIASQQAGFLP